MCGLWAKYEGILIFTEILSGRVLGRMPLEYSMQKWEKMLYDGIFPILYHFHYYSYILHCYIITLQQLSEITEII